MFFMTLAVTLGFSSMMEKDNDVLALALICGGISGISFHKYEQDVRRDYLRDVRRSRDRRKYGNRDFTQEDELIYKALKQKQ